MGSKVRRTFGTAFMAAGIGLLITAILLGSMVWWPDPWVEWLAQYWGLLGRERAGLSIFMYIVVAVTMGLALAGAGATLRGPAKRERADLGEGEPA